MQSSKIGRAFDRRAGHYDNPLTAYIGERELRQIRALTPSGARVLDYGCGTGRTTLDLLRRGCRVTAYDISAEMLALAEQKAHQAGYQAEWVVDPSALAGRTWPVITLVGVLDYYPDPLPLLNTVQQYLAPGGRLVATVPNSLSPQGWLYALGSRFTVPSTPRSAGFMQKTFARAGLRVQTVRYAFPAIPPIGYTMVFALGNSDETQ